MIKDLKELKKLFALCRAQGVTSIEVAGCNIKFGDKPERRSQRTEGEIIPVDGLTPEQLAFYSVGGIDQ